MATMTKGEMLAYLKENLPEIRILPIYILQSKSFYENRAAELKKMREVLPSGEWIVRSSSRQEDKKELSNAGKFRSVLRVPSQNDDLLAQAVKSVYDSYGTNEDEQILVQPMLTNLRKSGVVFTAELGTLAPYYVVNYGKGADSDAVTSGGTNELRTFICYKEKREYVQDEDMRRLLATCARLEGFLDNEFLDIEFGIDTVNEITIFQVRPIAYNSLNLDISANQGLGAVLAKVSKKVEKLSRPHPFLLGKQTYFGVMPDWNPAEMLGARPKTLAVTLYKELITDTVWAKQREDYGYRDLTSQPLMALFCGLPYIDTRVTFNSFVPNGLDEGLAEKLVDYYLMRLRTYPAYHDKVEFAIVFSCYYFGVEEKLKGLLAHGFTSEEISQLKKSLLKLTNSIIHPKYGLYKKDLVKTRQLELDYATIVQSDMSTIDKIYWLMEKCKIYGTRPFAGVARAGFIAVQLMDSLVSVCAISEATRSLFMASLNTVNKQMANDLTAYKAGILPKESFLSKYGHIRPGSYDITSPRYDETFDDYFAGAQVDSATTGRQSESFSLAEGQREAIQKLLICNGIKLNVNELLQFVKEAIEGREYVKFVFMKAVSEVLRLIAQLGERLHISREDMAYLDISEIKRLYVDLAYDDLSRIFLTNILRNKEQYRYERILKLPSLILSPSNIYAFYLPADEPNFIGQNCVVGETAQAYNDNADYKGKIVFISAADPGYDYLFTKGIGGLITQFGGANSHMAIRCAEMGLPAAIGVGEQKYNEWIDWKRLELNCAKKMVRRADIIWG